jgi:hypothetical protein
MLKIIMLNVIMPNVIMMNVMMPDFITLNVVVPGEMIIPTSCPASIASHVIMMNNDVLAILAMLTIASCQC